MFEKKSARLRALSMAALLLTGVGFVMWKSFARELSHDATTTTNTSSTTVPAQDATDKLEVELVTLRASGFEPLQITRPKGSFVLFVQDRSGKESSSFTLKQVTGQHLREVNTTRLKFEWYDVVNLPPGDYLLTTTNSDSICRLTILP
jgi:hypothetical protein